MTLDLKRARALVLAGHHPAEVLDLLDDPSRATLERIAVPAARAFDEATTRFLATGSTADGLAAMAASAVPGADVSLWEWLRKTSKDEVVQAVERAVLRETRERR